MFYGDKLDTLKDLFAAPAQLEPGQLRVLESLRGRRICDFGCGIGRWSYFLRHRCRELVLIDFSDAIFAARENLRGASNALFFLADITGSHSDRTSQT
jgi:SAM-dependent methyltransferase